ncbi:hypothetical protein FQN57_003457 [Myotisia sp. PD_48]|nr:hypothetical protein FQN57_003457 [Myotisia sp. PD_48]
MRFHIPYPPPKAGYWNPVTSTLNWCEEDYYATEYAAEIVNTVTNLLFIYLGIKGFRSCRKNGHDLIFQISFLGYLVVGLGSLLFHSTLKYPMQLLDELSMIYTTCFMCYATFSYSKSSTYRLVLGVGLTALAIFITLYYHYLQNPVFHQNAYAILTAVVIFRSMWMMEVTLRPSFQRSRLHRNRQGGAISSPRINGELTPRERRDMKTLRDMWVMVAFGLTTFLGGFLIWNLDNAFCPKIRGWRHKVGLPWGLFLEGHGWWHLLTGIGAYMYITWGIWLRHCLNHRQDEYKLHWPRLYRWAEIIRVQDPPRPIILDGSPTKLN